jgi:hypothetical protein
MVFCHSSFFNAKLLFVDVMTDKIILAMMQRLLVNCDQLNECESQQFDVISKVCSSVCPTDLLEKCAICEAGILSQHSYVFFCCKIYA